MAVRYPAAVARWLRRPLAAFALLALAACRAEAPPPAPAGRAPTAGPRAPASRAPAADPRAASEIAEPAQAHARPTAAAPATKKAPAPRPEAPPAYEAVTFVTKGAAAGDRLPLVIAIHGLGDRPDRFARALRGLDAPARVVAPAAPTPWHEGGSWFPVRARDPDIAALARGVAAAADDLAAFIRATAQQHPTRGKPIVTGFSQGGILSFAVAVRHPDLVAGAIPVGGLLPEPLYPKRPPERPVPIVALHGADDTVVAFDRAQATVDHLHSLGWPVRLVPFAGVGHAIPQPVHRAWLDTLAAACEGRWNVAR